MNELSVDDFFEEEGLPDLEEVVVVVPTTAEAVVPASAASDWMDVGECARELGVSGNTMRRLLRQDSVPVLRLSKRFRVRRSDFERLVEAHSGIMPE